jgi:hypothetical protein
MKILYKSYQGGTSHNTAELMGFNFLCNFNILNMRILRTDGGGENFTNERLQIARKMLFYFDIKNIYLLHDHKGHLCVIWESHPNKDQVEIVTKCWNFFEEYNIEHKIVEFKSL